MPQGKDKMSVPISASSSEDANGDKAFDSDSASYDAAMDDDVVEDEDEYDIGLRGGFVGGRTGSGGGVQADADYDLADDNATNTDSVFYGTSTTTTTEVQL